MAILPPDNGEGDVGSPTSSRAPASSHAAHKRSSSILSTNSVLSIPSRSSSVALNTSISAVPPRSSSIASPTKPGLPTSASDLAETIAGLSLADDGDTSATANGDEHSKGSTSLSQPNPTGDGGQTPLASTSAWMPSNHDSPRRVASGFGADDREEASMTETAEEIEDAKQAIEDVRRHIFVVQEKRHSSGFGGDAAAVLADPRSRSGSSGSSSTGSHGAGTNGGGGGGGRGNGGAEDVPAGDLDMALMQLDEKLETVSRSMQQLEVRMAEVGGPPEDQDPDSSIVDKEMLDWRSRQRRGSNVSFTSLTSFDELMLPSFAPALGPKALRSRYDDLLADWVKVQHEADALKKELNDDKYIVVFRSVSEQAKSMMDSLDKAITNCQTFVSDFNRDYQAGLISATSAASADAEADDAVGGERDPAARLAELADVKKAFTVKKSYYTPACDQVFQVLERGTKERGASNGTIIRKLADLKSRWRQMRERVLRTEKNMKRIEAILQRLQAGLEDPTAGSQAGRIAFPIAASASMPALPPAALGARQLQQTALGQGSPSRPALTPKSALRSSALGSRVTSGPGRLSSSSSLSSNLSGNGTPPPPPPPKSRLRRISATAEALGLQSQPISTPPRASTKTFDSPRSLRPQRSQNFATALSAARESAARHNRSSSAAFPENLALKNWTAARVGGSPPDTRRPLPSVSRPSALSNRGQGDARLAAEAVAQVSTPSRAPPSSYRSSWLGFDAAGAPGTPQRSKTPQPEPSWTSRSMQGSNAPPLPSQTARPSSRIGTSTPQSGRGRVDSGAAAEANEIEWIDNSSRASTSTRAPGSGDRPGSSLGGSYYRPPSATGTVGDVKARRRESMIPRLAVSSDATAVGSSTPSRPGSSLSQASNSTFTSGQNKAALTPPRYTAGASRLSMQTPEPTIMARAQRLSMYARAPSTGVAGMATPGTPASKRSSRPPITRVNPSLLAGMRNGGAAGGVGAGRTTPLSAAALASLPGADPSSVSSPSATNKRSSVANFRASRGLGGASVAGGGGGGGRVTPTLSDNGSIGGLSNATWTGQRLGSGSMAGSGFGGEAGRGARIEVYKPNPNDALDVEVAAIANGLGVSLERLDAPLPRGVRLEEGPGKDNRTRYEVGGKEVMCRLLELHRPAGSAGARAGTKAKKILVRVGGGWQDLEQWLLNRLSQQ
ncbi:uncharacterized protein PSFLO_01857 [Pseudozyma flocculosa]|uniref:GAR domain-containing protein n=1 Tax=Pseudozyma flocculosa TaxID=84751 RepID=A0A5C3EXP4_9BASI|nr:uncharacterized protein PSFLO_01857 [Pseudozyma flocculosa]